VHHFVRNDEKMGFLEVPKNYFSKGWGDGGHKGRSNITKIALLFLDSAMQAYNDEVFNPLIIWSSGLLRSSQ